MGRTQVYWVSRPEQLRCLASPIRHDIVDRLTALGPVSAASLARALAVKPTAIYRHLQKLEKLGLIRRREVSGKRGRPATIYEAEAPRMRLARASRNSRNRSVMARIGKVIAARAAREYREGFESPHWAIEGSRRNHWFFRLFAAPSPARLSRINDLLDEIAELIWTPDPRPGRLMSMTWLMSPVIEPGQTRKRKR